MLDMQDSGRVADVVPDETLCSDADLILAYRSVRSRLIDPLVPIHEFPIRVKTKTVAIEGERG